MSKKDPDAKASGSFDLSGLMFLAGKMIAKKEEIMQNKAHRKMVKENK